MPDSSTSTHAGCPVVHTDYRVDRPIFEHYRLLGADRELAPILWADFTPVPFWMITRYDYALEALQMPEVFSNDVVNAMDPGSTIELLPQTLNGAEHTRLRRVLNRWFSPAAVRRIEPLALRRCIELIEELAPAGECDLMTDFALRYPTDMFLATLGLPVEDGEQFLVWVEKVFGGFFGIDPEGAARAIEAIRGYFEAAADERAARPRDPETDFMTRLIRADLGDESISRHDLITICFTIMLAGLDTTRSSLGYIFHHLATHPGDRRMLISDPSGIPRAVEEFVRLYPLVIQDGRLVTQDIDFHGIQMKKGEVIWIGLGSANRDPREFPEPETFRLDRPNLSRHLGFAAGPHRCLGMHLARHELIIALGEWHKRIPDYEIEASVPLVERGGQLSLKHLPLRWPV